MRLSTKIIALLAVVVAGCASKPPVQTVESQMVFPYTADTNREAQILEAIPQIQVGMHVNETTDIAGEPDQIRPLYEPKIYNPKQIGTTRWYYLQINAPGETNSAKLMRLSVDPSGLVTSVDHWGIADKGG